LAQKTKKTTKKKPNKKPEPIVLSINICDSIIRDEATKKVSLIGLFNIIRAPNFPAFHQTMHVYVALTNGHGKYKTEIRFCDTKEQAIAGIEGELNFQSPLQVVELNLPPWTGLRLEEEGTYFVEVLCDGKPIGSRKFQVIGPGRPNLTSRTEGV
jgi:hypothetical protein